MPPVADARPGLVESCLRALGLWEFRCPHCAAPVSERGAFCRDCAGDLAPSLAPCCPG